MAGGSGNASAAGGGGDEGPGGGVGAGGVGSALGGAGAGWLGVAGGASAGGAGLGATGAGGGAGCSGMGAPSDWALAEADQARAHDTAHATNDGDRSIQPKLTRTLAHIFPSQGPAFSTSARLTPRTLDAMASSALGEPLKW